MPRHAYGAQKKTSGVGPHLLSCSLLFAPKQLALEPAGIFLSASLILLRVWITDRIDHM